MSSEVTNATTLYSTSVLNLATTLCSLLFHDIKLPPTSTQYAEVDRPSLGEPAQSADG